LKQDLRNIESPSISPICEILSTASDAINNIDEGITID
jgi:hypothetical protein